MQRRIDDPPSDGSSASDWWSSPSCVADRRKIINVECANALHTLPVSLCQYHARRDLDLQLPAWPGHWQLGPGGQGPAVASLAWQLAAGSRWPVTPLRVPGGRNKADSGSGPDFRLSRSRHPSASGRRIGSAPGDGWAARRGPKPKRGVFYWAGL